MTPKRPDIETLKTLEGELNFLFKKIDEHESELLQHLKKMPQKAFVIASAYALSSVYSCYEDIFKHIAKTFENRIENLASWHSELLNRMMIEVPDIRPHVISEASFAVLNEMRSFRHVFRSSYVFVIDSERILALSKKWSMSKFQIKKEIETFLAKIYS